MAGGGAGGQFLYPLLHTHFAFAYIVHVSALQNWITNNITKTQLTILSSYHLLRWYPYIVVQRPICPESCQGKPVSHCWEGTVLKPVPASWTAYHIDSLNHRNNQNIPLKLLGKTLILKSRTLNHLVFCENLNELYDNMKLKIIDILFRYEIEFCFPSTYLSICHTCKFSL